MTDKNFGKGALRTPHHIRAKQFVLGAIPAIVDWSKPYNVENGFTVAQRNQNGSLSCTAQATCYYEEALQFLNNKENEQYSARYNYSQSFERNGGAYIWKAMSIPLKGSTNSFSVPDVDSSENIMRDNSLNGQAPIIVRAEKYAMTPNPHDIDALAAIVERVGGFITGFDGQDGMFLPDGTAKIPTNPTWGHAVWVCGHEMRNGIKCLKFKNSWSANWGSNGYGFFPEEFVKSGFMFDTYVYADVKDLDNNMTDAQLNKLYLLGFKRPVDDGGRTTWGGKDFDTIIDGLIASPENQEYTKIFESVKNLENDVRSGKF